MSIKIDTVRQAMLLLIDPHARHVSTAEQLASSLKIYQSRGEYDGTLESAVECLEMACYEIEKD